MILAQFLRGCSAFTGIVLGEARVPPDASVDILRNLLAGLIGAGFAGRAVLMYQFGVGDHHLRGFTLASVHINFRFLRRTAVLRSAVIEDIDDVIVGLVALGLRGFN